MVGFVAWQQTPPAIEQQVPRHGNDWWGDKTGGTRNGISREASDEGEVVSNTLTLHGETGLGGKIAAEKRDVKSEPHSPDRQKQHTIAFSEFLFERKTVELVSLLNQLKQNLHNAEGAAIMTNFRRSLEQIWNVAGDLPREKIIIVSAVEEAVRNKKWRELTIGQVEVLEHVLSSVNLGAEYSKNELGRAFSAIHRSQIDVYPSAAEDFDDEETETTE